MSFFGGGTDFPEFFKEYGGAVLSTTFDKYCYVTVRHLPRFFDYTSELCYSKIEKIKYVEDIEHPLIREAMRMLDIHEIRLTYESDLPRRSGLGTSSSFAVGMLNSFHLLKGQYRDKKTLADEAIYLEREICREAGGYQDQIAASFGGLNKITFGADGYSVDPVIIYPIRKRKLNANLMLFFTGFSRYSFKIQTNTRRGIKDRIRELLEMKALTEEAEKVLVNPDRDLNDFGRLLDHSWKLKRELNPEISTETIDIIYQKAKAAGALGGKILGAGGGGFILLYVELDKQKQIREALKDLLYVPFQFAEKGTSTIYYVPEPYIPEGEIRSIQDDVWYDDNSNEWKRVNG